MLAHNSNAEGFDPASDPTLDPTPEPPTRSNIDGGEIWQPNTTMGPAVARRASGLGLEHGIETPATSAPISPNLTQSHPISPNLAQSSSKVTIPKPPHVCHCRLSECNGSRIDSLQHTLRHARQLSPQIGLQRLVRVEESPQLLVLSRHLRRPAQQRGDGWTLRASAGDPAQRIRHRGSSAGDRSGEGDPAQGIQRTGSSTGSSWHTGCVRVSRVRVVRGHDAVCARSADSFSPSSTLRASSVCMAGNRMG